MGYKVERLEDEPIIVVTWANPVNPEKDIRRTFAEIDTLIEPGESVYCINDLRELKVNFGMIVAGMGTARLKEPGSPRDPRLTSMLVSSSKLFELVSKSASQAQYGGVNVPIFTTMEDALARARREEG